MVEGMGRRRHQSFQEVKIDNQTNKQSNNDSYLITSLLLSLFGRPLLGLWATRNFSTLVINRQ